MTIVVPTSVETNSESVGKNRKTADKNVNMSKKSHKQYHSRLFRLYIVLFIGFRKTVSHITVSLQTWELLMKFIRNNTTQMLQISELWRRDSVNTVGLVH